MTGRLTDLIRLFIHKRVGPRGIPLITSQSRKRSTVDSRQPDHQLGRQPRSTPIKGNTPKMRNVSQASEGGGGAFSRRMPKIKEIASEEYSWNGNETL